ncbi:MAG: hypothetical protein M1461_01435 [Nitrospirae bacterium]|nr:hypothetical protein [Nitrospirota bacterium]
MSHQILVNVAFILNAPVFLACISVLYLIITKLSEKLNNESENRIHSIFNGHTHRCENITKLLSDIGTFIREFYSFTAVSRVKITAAIVLFLGLIGLCLAGAGLSLDQAYSQCRDNFVSSLNSNNIQKPLSEKITNENLAAIRYMPYISTSFAIVIGFLNVILCAFLFFIYGLLKDLVVVAFPRRIDK